MSESEKFIQVSNYRVDNQKNLFKKVNDDYLLIQKLKKDVFKMIEYEQSVYFIDTFGDCYLVLDQPKFLFGILSQPSYFYVLNHRIYSIDKYSRVWIHDLEGEVLNIAFLKENILSVNIQNDYSSVTTDGEVVSIDYTNKNSNKDKIERKLMILDRSFELIRLLTIDKIVKYESDSITAIVNGKEEKYELKDHSSRKSLKTLN